MAGNKNKRQYHKAPDRKISIISSVRLSQCMIVKNEEKNIEKALSWGKGHVFEQIVVDTGSTDRTVEIAKSMGAKVFHFEWIDDFSAAKNYAIEQASGNWIAFLDADEYFVNKDVLRLMQMLNGIESDPVLRKKKTALRCPIANVDNDGKPISIFQQDRVFKNTQELRYFGKIHERLELIEPHFLAEELTIIHTGYSSEVYTETGKAVRNVDMLRRELVDNPDDGNLKCYLADSLVAIGGAENSAEADTLYREALDGGMPIVDLIKQNALNRLIVKDFDDEERKEENYKMCREAYEEFPNNPDFCYFYARKLYVEKDYEATWEKLIECENLLNATGVGMANAVLNNILIFFLLMVLTAEELGKLGEVIRCATLLLKENKYQPGVLAPYIAAFKSPDYEVSDEEILDLLRKIYDFSSIKDKIEVLKAAKTVKNMHLVGLILSEFSPEEMEWLVKAPE